ncbi:MAG: tetratricopeptide repeat-containing sensor histidine kinase [Bacteroidales bacterium]|nr:tetratricopeptide repeat-containing sensor histidine kinase [Bacteroidales bacterium]
MILLFIPDNLTPSNLPTTKDTSNNIQQIEIINNNIEFLRQNISKPHDSLKKVINQTIQLSLAENYSYGLAWNYFLLGRFYQLKEKNDSAIIYYQKAWPLVKAQQESRLVYAVSIGLGNIFWETGNYSSGLELTLEAEQYFEQHNAIENKYDLLNLIALNYEGLFQYQKALEYFNRAIESARKFQQEDFEGVILSNLGRLYFKQGDYQKALYSIRKGVKLEEKNLFFSSAGRSYTMMANAFLQLQQYDSTLVYLKKAYAHNINTDDKVGLARTYLGYGEYYYQINQHSTSVDYLFKAIEVGDPIQLDHEILTSFKLLANNFEETGNISKSNEYLKKYFSLYQQIYNVERLNQLNSLEHRLKLQIKENQIHKLKIKEEEQTIQYLTFITIAGLLFIILLLIFIFFYRRNNQLLKQKNKEIHQQKNNLEELNKKLILAETNAGKADEIKTRFLNTLSHEIRTPLNGIVGFSSLIADSKLSEEKKPHYWSVIRKNSEDLMNTIDGLLELSLAASGSIKINQSTFDVFNFLDQLKVEIKEKYSHLNKEVDFKVHNNTSFKKLFVTTDQEMIRKSILRVVDNAFKFTLKGKIELGADKKRGFLQFIVSDTGLGIAEDTPGEIFIQFIKGKNIPNNSGGLGIGLTITSYFVKLMGGKISYETELNKGSKFIISIPANDEQ